MSEKERLLRKIPQVDGLARREDLAQILDREGRALGLRLLRDLLDVLRCEIQADVVGAHELEVRIRDLGPALEASIAQILTSSAVPILNATGVVVHTNLGRSVLCQSARDAQSRMSSGYANLEYDLDEGTRGSRMSHLEAPLRRLFPGRASIAVNNNAGAVLLALNSLAAGKEVIVSRGELVEIGGSFRIPDIMERSGAVLREVGTTNRTRIADYRQATGPETGALLKVHPSNYRILGFAEETTLAELAELGKEHGLPVILDQGSGNLVDLSSFGVHEPPVSSLLDQGADLVLFSGDKLLGGPQAGLAVGREDLIAAMRKNPMARALRLDKGTVAALEATLGEYVRGTALESIPTLRMLAATAAEIEERAQAFVSGLPEELPAEVEIIDGGSVVGGGSWPLGELPTRLIAVRPRHEEAGKLERRLRSGRLPVIARVEEGRLLLDLRTVAVGEENSLQIALVAACDPG